MNELREVFERAAELLSDVDRWTNLSLAVDKEGLDVIYSAEKACKWCLQGAVRKFCYEMEVSSTHSAIVLLDKVSQELYQKDSLEVNDELGYEAVKQVLSRVLVSLSA